MKILLIRHGQSTGNVEARFTGHIDLPLTELGKSQAKILCDYILKNYTVDKVYTSELMRAKSTVKSLAETLKLTVNTDKRINELNLGKWEGKLISELKATYPEELDRWSKEPKTFFCPDGESFENLYDRAVEFLTEICKTDDKTVYVCAHGGVIRSLLCFIKYGNVEHISKVDWGTNASVTELEFVDGKFTIIKEFYDDFLIDLKSGYLGVL